MEVDGAAAAPLAAAARVFRASREFRAPANFTRGVCASPDGLCLLVGAADRALRLFEVPAAGGDEAQDAASVLQFQEAGALYDVAWYPFMSSADPASCIFVSTSQDQPVHMWDAYTGALRATYRAFDHLDELAAANSVAFNASGSRIFCGFDRMVRFFDVSQPSRDFCARATSQTRRSRQGQRGIISSLHFNPDHSKIYAAGSYAGTTCVYTEDEGEELLALRDHDGKGITQTRFSPCGRFLFTAARRDSRIHCWDIRNSTQIVQTFHRVADTNQRIEFDLHCGGRLMATGSRDGRVSIYDIITGELLHDSIQLPDCANGVSFIPDPTRISLAVSSGQRHYDLHEDMDDDDDDDDQVKGRKDERNVVEVYDFGTFPHDASLIKEDIHHEDPMVES